MKTAFIKNFENYSFSKELLEYNNIQELHNKLDGFLKNIGEESKLNMIHPQVLIVDDLFRITDLYFLPFKNPTQEDKYRFDKFRVSLLGYELGNTEDLLFYNKILNNIKNSNSDCLYFLCTGGGNQNCDKKKFLFDDYIINELEPINNSSNQPTLKSIEWDSQIVFATGENAEFLIKQDIQKYLEYFCVILVKWPGNKITKKQMYGICGFLFDPEMIESGSFGKQVNLLNSFKNNYKEIRRITDSIQTTLYLTQLFAMYQAAIENPFKLTEYLITSAKTKNLKDLIQCKIRQIDFIQILNIPSINAIRKIFRSLNEEYDKNSNIAFNTSSIILKALYSKNKQIELEILFQKSIPPILNDKENQYSKYVHIILIYNTLKNVHCFYKKGSIETNTFIENTILAFAQFLISEQSNNFFEINEKLDPLFIRESFYDLLLRTIEDAYEYLNDETWKKLVIYFEKLIRNKKFIDLFNAEKIIESLFLALYFSPEAYQIKLIELICFYLDKYFPPNRIFILAQKQFSFLSIDIQYQLIKEISKLNKNELIYIKEQLEQRYLNQKNYLSLLKESDSYTNSEKLQIFNVISTKGGVGKTMVSLSLASKLAPPESGKKVCLIDLDFFGPTLAYFLELKQKSYSLNDYIWSNFLIDNKKEIEDNELLQKWTNKIFEYYSFWKKRYDDFDFNKNKISDNEENWVTPELFILPACLNKEVQGLMNHLITYKWAMNKLSSIITHLIISLKKQEFDYIIFDCPAELKELSIVASKHSIYSKAKNVFVTTLAENCLVPTINTLSDDYYVRTVNYLVLNKVQQADGNLINSKLDLIDYYSSLEKDKTSIPSASITQRKLFFNFNEINVMKWNESLENIFNIRHDDLKEVLEILKEKTSDSLENLIN